MKTHVRCDNISIYSSYNEICFRQVVDKNQYVYKKKFVSENRAVYEIMWKNMVVPDRPPVTIQYGACALHAG
jgi:hypothetical protein